MIMKDNKDYESMTREELYEMAKEKEIPGKSNMTKEQLIEALQKGGDQKSEGGGHKGEGGGQKGEGGSQKEKEREKEKSSSHSHHGK